MSRALFNHNSKLPIMLSNYFNPVPRLAFFIYCSNLILKTYKVVTFYAMRLNLLFLLK